MMDEEKDEVIRETERKLFVVEQEREEKDEEINRLEHGNYVESLFAKRRVYENEEM